MNTAPHSTMQLDDTPKIPVEDVEYAYSQDFLLHIANERRAFEGKRPLKSLKIDPMAAHKVKLYQPGNATVVACGHRWDIRQEPRFVNCRDCWNVYFQCNQVATQAAAKLAEAFGQLAVKKEKGKKFYRAFIAYIDEMQRKAEEKFKAEAEQPAPEPFTEEQQAEFAKSIEFIENGEVIP